MESKMITVETDRLILRPFQLKDIEPSFEMNKDPEVVRYTGDGGSVTLEEVERRIKENVLGDYRKHGFGRFAVEYKESGQFIGFVGLKYLEDLDEVDLGYRLIQEYWGKGIATEASRASLEFGFHKLELDRIIAIALPENERSINVMKKLNFTFEKETFVDEYLVHQYALNKANFS